MEKENNLPRQSKTCNIEPNSSMHQFYTDQKNLKHTNRNQPEYDLNASLNYKCSQQQIKKHKKSPYKSKTCQKPTKKQANPTLITNLHKQYSEQPSRQLQTSKTTHHPKRIQQLLKLLKTNKSQIKLLKQSPYCQNKHKKKIIEQIEKYSDGKYIKMKKSMMMDSAYRQSKVVCQDDDFNKKYNNKPSSQAIRNLKDKSSKPSSEQTLKIQVYIRNLIPTATMHNNYSHTNRSSKRGSSNTRKYDNRKGSDYIQKISNDYDSMYASYIEIPLQQCLNQERLMTDKCIVQALKNSQQSQYLKNSILQNIIGFQVEKSYLENQQAPNQQTLTYMLALGLLTPQTYIPLNTYCNPQGIVLKIKPIVFKISNIAAAIISTTRKNNQYLTQKNTQRIKNLSKNFTITINDFKIVQCLGSGGFSTVYLVRGNFNNKYYAMKLIDKKFIIQSQRKGIVSSQRFILEKLSINNKNVKQTYKTQAKQKYINNQKDCSFFTHLEFAFETNHHFIFMIQYCPGGELFNRLKTVKKMDEDQARFYFLQILAALDYIHSCNVVYRDLKPQNLLIDHQGHIKIADFGLSKYVQTKNQLSYSFCGSPEYMAPEMLTKQGHNYLLDYYCLGALLYELVVGVPPYYSLNQDEIYDSILTQQLTFPSHVSLSPEIRSLLNSLLKKQSRHRLGSMYGIKQIMAHPWVGRIKLTKIINRQLQPPYVPDLSKFNFDLEDIKSNLTQIRNLLDQDRKCKKFQTCFSDQFGYINPIQMKDIHQKIKVHNSSTQQINSSSRYHKQNMNYRNNISIISYKKSTSCQSLRSRTFKQNNKNVYSSQQKHKNIYNSQQKHKKYKLNLNTYRLKNTHQNSKSINTTNNHSVDHIRKNKINTKNEKIGQIFKKKNKEEKNIFLENIHNSEDRNKKIRGKDLYGYCRNDGKLEGVRKIIRNIR